MNGRSEPLAYHAPMLQPLRTTALLSLLATLHAAPTLAQPLESTTAARAAAHIDSLLEASVAEDGPGHLVRVIQDGEVVYDHAVGLANIGERTPLASSTPVYLASLAKPFTAVAVLLLAERGALELDASIRQYLPGLPDFTDPVTVRSMLTHTSGLIDHYDLLAGEPGGLTNEIVFALVAGQDSLLFPPGERVKYSNAAYVLLAMAVERVSGRSFGAFLDAHVFEPLGMTSTVVHDGRPAVPGRAIGYQAKEEGFVVDDYRSFTTGAGGIYASAEDLTRFDAGLDRLLSPGSLRQMWSVPDLPAGRRTPYGMGWLVECAPRGPLAGLDYVASTGSLNGFRTFLKRFEDPRLTVIVLSNGGAWLPPFDLADLYLADRWTAVEDAGC